MPAGSARWVCAAAGHPGASVLADGGRVSSNDLQVADEGSVGADERAVGGKGLDREEVDGGAMGVLRDISRTYRRGSRRRSAGQFHRAREFRPMNDG